MILQKFEFDKSYKFENYSGINEVFCDKKTLLNKLALILLILVVLLARFNVIATFIAIITPSEFNLWDSEDLFIAIFGLIIFLIPTMLLFLNVINFKFYINNKNVSYKNWLGRKFSYSTTDIKKVYLHRSRKAKYITIEFNDTEEISISAGDKNFKKLKDFFGF